VVSRYKISTDIPNYVKLWIMDIYFDLISKEIKLLNDNYLDQFYDFINFSKSGRIW